MDAHTVMEEWEVSPFDGGFKRLRELQSRRFSGAVEVGTSWCFFRDGDPLAVVEDLQVDPRPGTVDAFENASGQTHEATHPATASLAAMLALDGETRGQYYTEDTPLSAVHETLSDGGFTGYVELAENVLSGDYYVVYEDGDEDYLGILGSSQRLITNDEAESKAEGEVGIYSVVAVSYPDVELPDPKPQSKPDSAGVDATTTETGTEGNPGETTPPLEADEPTDETAGLDAESTETTPESNAESERQTPEQMADSAIAESTEAETETEPEPEAEAETEPETEPETESGGDGEPSRVESADAAPKQQASTASETRTETAPETESKPEPNSEAETAETETQADASAHTSGDSVGRRDDGGRADSETTDESTLEGVTSRTVPSLDPERTGRAETDSADSRSAERRPQEAATSERPTAEQPQQKAASEPESASESDPKPQQDPDVEARIETLRKEYEERIEKLQSELETLRSERDRLRERVSELEAADSSADTASGGAALSPTEALSGTSLFVREDTRGEATLEEAHAGKVDRETLDSNLRIEYHTQFDDEDATVGGEPFDAWLRSSPAYEFVEWLIVELLFEIQSTASKGGMRHLYDALPEIDRVGFEDTITVGDGQNGREITFDVVARNRMGEPLVAANIDESRDPTRAETMQPLITDAEDVSMDHDTLAATFAVTSSYFEPDALDAAREATSGSLLSREKYYSYVKLARKTGFHLCLVEARRDSFHLAVPEL